MSDTKPERRAWRKELEAVATRALDNAKRCHPPHEANDWLTVVAKSMDLIDRIDGKPWIGSFGPAYAIGPSEDEIRAMVAKVIGEAAAGPAEAEAA